MLRWRILFSRGEEVKFLSHLDLMRLWERALRRAGLPLAYSQGFSPRPHLSLALPLPLGVTSQAELLDIWLTTPLPLKHLMAGLSRQLPRGVEIAGMEAVLPQAPSLPSLMRAAEYQVTVAAPTGTGPGGGNGVEAAIAAFLSSPSFPWQHRRDKEVRRYDLRPLVEDIWLEEGQGEHCRLGMRLRADASGAGRADQVALALGLRPLAIHRTRLLLRGQ